MDKETLLALRGEFTRLKNRQGIQRILTGICDNIDPALCDAASELWKSLGYDSAYPVEVDGYVSNRDAFNARDADGDYVSLWEGEQGEARNRFLRHLIAHIDNVLAGGIA